MFKDGEVLLKQIRVKGGINNVRLWANKLIQ